MKKIYIIYVTILFLIMIFIGYFCYKSGKDKTQMQKSTAIEEIKDIFNFSENRQSINENVDTQEDDATIVYEILKEQNNKAKIIIKYSYIMILIAIFIIYGIVIFAFILIYYLINKDSL